MLNCGEGVDCLRREPASQRPRDISREILRVVGAHYRYVDVDQIARIQPGQNRVRVVSVRLGGRRACCRVFLHRAHENM